MKLLCRLSSIGVSEWQPALNGEKCTNISWYWWLLKVVLVYQKEISRHFVLSLPSDACVCVGSFLLSAVFHVSSRVRIGNFFAFLLPHLHFLAEHFESVRTMEGLKIPFFLCNYVYIFLSKASKCTGMFLPYILYIHYISKVLGNSVLFVSLKRSPPSLSVPQIHISVSA